MASSLLSPDGSFQSRSAAASDPLIIGLVNNMPDGALEATERQFTELLSAAADGREVWLRVFAIPNLQRGDAARRRVEQRYERIETLWQAKLDGLIVTGMEPRSPEFEDEPYWTIFARLVEWTGEHTISTIWSCLAAHAAAYHLDGIKRRALGGKLSGIFECALLEQHTLLKDCPSCWAVPHSRHYEVPEELLSAHGYSVLTGSPAVGADIFTKEATALHVFLQGHLEYDPAALALEYRRDVRRYLRGETDSYPEIPRGTFDRETEAGLGIFRQEATPERGAALIAAFPNFTLAAAGGSAWRTVAQQLYRNWLSYLAERKSAHGRGPAFAAALNSSQQLAPV